MYASTMQDTRKGGSVVKRVLEKRSEPEVEEVLWFCNSMGLPVFFAQLIMSCRFAEVCPEAKVWEGMLL